MDFAEYLENQTFQRSAKFVEMKGIVILIKVKVNEMYNNLKSLLREGYTVKFFFQGIS